MGGLANFAARLRNDAERTSLVARIPPNWSRDVLNKESDDEDFALIQASALLSTFLAAGKVRRKSDTIRSAYRPHIRRIVDQLIVIAAAPPTARNLEAQVLLGRLSRFAVEATWDQLETSIRTHPLGFRSWRAVTKLVRLGEHDASLIRNLRSSVRELLLDAENLRSRSLYPARSLDLELAIEIPEAWVRGDDYAREVLRRRMNSPSATLRERGTAAHGLLERARKQGGPGQAEAEELLWDTARQFCDAPDRDDIDSGLKWVGTTLGSVLEESRAIVCNQWPDVPDAWYEKIAEAARDLERDIPIPRLASATRTLFLHVLLQNAGVYRRVALDALVAGGWTEDVLRALGKVLRDDEIEEWVRIRALFAVGFLQHRTASARRVLVAATKQALEPIIDPSGERLTGAQITEAHAALFAVGDLFGARGAEGESRLVRDELGSLFERLAVRVMEDARLSSVARALAYAAIFTAQSAGVDEEGVPGEDIAQTILRDLAGNKEDDPITAEVCEWALRFRFLGGQVRPLLYSIHPSASR